MRATVNTASGTICAENNGDNGSREAGVEKARKRFWEYRVDGVHRMTESIIEITENAELWEWSRAEIATEIKTYSRKITTKWWTEESGRATKDILRCWWQQVNGWGLIIPIAYASPEVLENPGRCEQNTNNRGWKSWVCWWPKMCTWKRRSPKCPEESTWLMEGAIAEETKCCRRTWLLLVARTQDLKAGESVRGRRRWRTLTSLT